MADDKSEKKRTGRRYRVFQRIAAFATFVLMVIAALRQWWPFNAHPAEIRTFKRPSVWQYLFSDRATLGFARAAIAALAVYMVVSVPALVIASRWMRAFGTGGMTADDAEDAGQTIADLEAQVEDLTGKLDVAVERAEQFKKERDAAADVLREIRRRQTSSETGPASQSE